MAVRSCEGDELVGAPGQDHFHAGLLRQQFLEPQRDVQRQGRLRVARSLGAGVTPAVPRVDDDAAHAQAELPRHRESAAGVGRGRRRRGRAGQSRGGDAAAGVGGLSGRLRRRRRSRRAGRRRLAASQTRRGAVGRRGRGRRIGRARGGFAAAGHHQPVRGGSQRRHAARVVGRVHHDARHAVGVPADAHLPDRPRVERERGVAQGVGGARLGQIEEDRGSGCSRRSSRNCTGPSSSISTMAAVAVVRRRTSRTRTDSGPAARAASAGLAAGRPRRGRGRMIARPLRRVRVDTSGLRRVLGASDIEHLRARPCGPARRRGGRRCRPTAAPRARARCRSSRSSGAAARPAGRRRPPGASRPAWEAARAAMRRGPREWPARGPARRRTALARSSGGPRQPARAQARRGPGRGLPRARRAMPGAVVGGASVGDLITAIAAAGPLPRSTPCRPGPPSACPPSPPKRCPRPPSCRRGARPG